MDLGDFVPEDQEVRFGIGKHRYLVRFAEAKVDEVFAMIASEPNGGTPAGEIEKHRRIVTRFLCQHVVDGDAKTLAEDLKLLPYASANAPVTVLGLYDLIQLRVKKTTIR